ncbi:EAL domain-containing protein [Undibacterium sp. Rencai35W]|uniref:EAL domain-containing protein n=1 Tax=Undibacterium sp. Rencai35W TaxID=3413046 RepID=UPI003BF45AB7
MDAPPFPHNESERIAALHALNVLDTGPKAELDALVKAASLVCGVPISLISLVDTEKVWLKANLGLPGVSEVPRDMAFCSFAILENGMLEIQDTLQDHRFADNPLVINEPLIRFYAGAPISIGDGHRIGTLCVLDKQPQHLNAQQREILLSLADTAAAILEGHRDKRALLEKGQRFADIIESTHVGTWEKNFQTGAIKYNERWAEITGRTLAELGELSAQTWVDLTHPSDRILSQLELENHFNNRVYRYECEVRLRHKNGSWIWVLDSGRVISWTSEGKPEWMLGTLLDITERKHQEENLRKSQLFLDRTGKLAGIGGWEVDLITNDIYWSDETCRIHGVAAGFKPTMDEAIRFYAPAAQPVILSAVQNAILKGKGWDLELPFIRADGSPIWVRAVGTVEFADKKPIRLFGAFQDITQRVEENLALQAANDRTTLATDSGAIGIWEYDLISGTVIWDAWMYRLFGLVPRNETSTIELWLNQIHPADVKKIEYAAKQAVRGENNFDTEYRVIWPDGSLHYLKGSAIVKRDAEGTALRMVGTAIDISVPKKLALELAEQHALLHVTLKSIGDAVITTDSKGYINWLNPVAERMTGWLVDEAKGRSLTQVFHIVNEETRKPAANPITACLAQEKVVGLATRTILISRNGTEYGVEDSAAPIRNERGEVLGVVLVFHDVTEQRRLSGEMNFRASHDLLTGLVNRAEFEVRLRRVLQMAHSDHSQHALLYIDLDQFKLVNDACGHAVGDQLLQQVAKLFAETARTRDTLARLGGDEFAILLEQCSVDQAQRVAQKICDRMDDFRFTHDNRRFRIGASIGLVPVDSRWPITEAIMQAADTSCYAAKEAGRNRVHAWFDTDLAMRARHGEMQWTTRIEQALDDNHFVLYAQKIIALNDQSPGLHAEVLLRMRDTDGSLIGPGAFLPAAERFQLATRIDKWVLKHTIAWMKTLTSIDHIGKLSVNLSGQSVGDRAFHRWAIDLLKDTGSRICSRLCLEITETAAVTNLSDAALFIEQIREIGVRVALDDFGAGASSFGYLKKMPVDYLKIDGQFVVDVVTDPLDEAAVRCFADVAKVVGVKTVAEFVDHPAVLAKLREIGIDFAQGFLLHKPAPIDELAVHQSEILSIA